MGASVFVDTSAWVAFFAPKDERHEEAVDAFEELGEGGTDFVTTEYVLAESVTRVRYLAGHSLAVRAWDQMEQGGYAHLVGITADHRRAARAIFEKYDALKLSLVDCVSFAVMKEFGIREALTFDDDFRKAGFVALPRRRMK